MVPEICVEKTIFTHSSDILVRNQLANTYIQVVSKLSLFYLIGLLFCSCIIPPCFLILKPCAILHCLNCDFIIWKFSSMFLSQGFSASVQPTFGARYLFLVGTCRMYWPLCDFLPSETLVPQILIALVALGYLQVLFCSLFFCYILFSFYNCPL